MDDVEFSRLMKRARDGDDDAIGALLREFEDDVRLMVRVRLPRALRAQFDSMDFVQAVWKSVLADPDARETDFSGAGHFRGFLAGVARNKVNDEYRRRTRRRKYDLNREEPLYVRRGGRDLPRELAAADPTPSQQIQAIDCLERLVSGRSPREAEILELRRLDLTFEEVADRLGLSDRTVRRVIDEARLRLEREEARP